MVGPVSQVSFPINTRRPATRRVGPAMTTARPPDSGGGGGMGCEATLHSREAASYFRPMGFWRRLFGGSGAGEINPQRLDYLNEALALERQGDYDAALTSYRLALRDHPNDARILQNMAIAFTKTRRIDEAIRHYRRALELDRELAGAHYGLAFLLLKRGDLSGDQVGVDVVGFAARAHAHGRDHRDESGVLEEPDRLGVHRLHLAHQTDVHLLAVREPVQPPACPEQPRVLARQPHRLAAVVVDQTDDGLVDLAHQDHLDDLDGLLVGHSHAPHELGLLAEPLHEGADLRAATVDDDGLDAHETEQDHVERERLLEVRALHRGAAVLDDDGLTPKLPDVRERLEEHLRPPKLTHRLACGSRSQNVPRQVLVARDVAQASRHVAGVDGQLLAGHVRSVERDLIQQ